MNEVAVVIASAGRPDVLAHLLRALVRQTHRQVHLVVAVPDESSLPDDKESGLPKYKRVVGTRGLAAQRNAGLAALPAGIRLVFFFDDDAIPREDYISNAYEFFSLNPQVVALTGRVVVDGAAEGTEIPLQIATKLLNQSRNHCPSADEKATELYGCNFAVRFPVVRDVSFDERLPLYSWLEDLDFSRRVKRVGSLAKVNKCVIAHLGSASGGRTQHIRFGYSQITNPIYLTRKGSLSYLQWPKLIGRPVLSNLLGAVVGQETQWRRDRLRGNWLSLNDLLHGNVEPERIMTLN